MTTPSTTIVIPHYKTLELTKLCLRLIRLHTDLQQAQVLVIDNGSQDASTTYLQQVKWIKLIIRDTSHDQSPWESHASALDEALNYVNTPYMISLHTDTMVKHPQWLPFILQHIDGKPNVAGVGSWKLEAKPWHKRFAKAIERTCQLGWYRLLGKSTDTLYGIGKQRHYLRSHCALYRTDLLKQQRLHFVMGGAAGKGLHYALEKSGYDMVFLSSEALGQYMDHLNHATMVLNPTEMQVRSKTINRGLKRIRKALTELQAEKILADENLDR